MGAPDPPGSGTRSPQTPHLCARDRHRFAPARRIIPETFIWHVLCINQPHGRHTGVGGPRRSVSVNGMNVIGKRIIALMNEGRWVMVQGLRGATPGFMRTLACTDGCEGV